jgi:hypothetical protein
MIWRKGFASPKLRALADTLLAARSIPRNKPANAR